MLNAYGHFRINIMDRQRELELRWKQAKSPGEWINSVQCCVIVSEMQVHSNMHCSMDKPGEHHSKFTKVISAAGILHRHTCRHRKENSGCENLGDPRKEVIVEWLQSFSCAR